MKTVPAKIILQNDQVFLLKHCKEHGQQKELFEEDQQYHLKKKHYDKPGTTMKVYSQIDKGCPYDCGPCSMHDQHACIGLIEITQRCNMNCPVCYANANQGEFLSLKKIGEMMDFFQASEGNQAEVLQISGGEPTLHPNIIEIIQMARDKNIQYVMLNTNGIRMAEDEAFVRTLKQFVGGFEVYLQFDGLSENVHQVLRGANILEMKLKAIENLCKFGVPTTLVSTVTRGINDGELGNLFAFALEKPYIRGINFQPMAFFGRNNQPVGLDRITLSGILKRLTTQTQGLLQMDDFIPLPCNVERVAISYLIRSPKGGYLPITRNTKIKEYLHLINNTFVFKIEDYMKKSQSNSDFMASCDCFKFLLDFRKLVPRNFFSRTKEQKIDYVDQNTFRVSVSSFVDAYNFDIKSIQKECVHVITEDLRKIPFSAYNMLYRLEAVDE